jgi:hypothetical protein
VKGSTTTVVCGRPGRSVGVAGLGVIIYRHGWLVNIGQGTTPKSDRQAAQAFGTLIKEMMGLQPTTGGLKTVMQQAMIADGTLAYTSRATVVGRKQGCRTPSRDLSKNEIVHTDEMARAQNVPR